MRITLHSCYRPSSVDETDHTGMRAYRRTVRDVQLVEKLSFEGRWHTVRVGVVTFGGKDQIVVEGEWGWLISWCADRPGLTGERWRAAA